MHLNSKKYFFVALFVAVVNCLPSTSQAQLRAGMSYLKVIPGTRQVGMAGALTGALDNMAASYANPGATGFLREWQWSASYTRWIPDVYDASLIYGRAVATPWSDRTRMALGLSYLGIKNFDSTNGREPAATGNEVLAAVSFGQPLDVLSGQLSLGGSLKYYRSSLSLYAASAFVLDMGMLFRTPRFRFIPSGLGLFDEAILSAGIAVTQLGNALRFQAAKTPLPKTVRAGFALNTGSHRGLQLALSADYRSIRDEDPFAAIGMEISWQHMLYWRGGYHFEENNVLGHFAVGLSLGLDDTRTSLPGPNNAARFDLAKSEDNLFFASPARGSINHFPTRPEQFTFVSPAPEAVTLATTLKLQWQPSRDPDLFDAANYVALIAKDRASIARILSRLEGGQRQSLIALFRDSTAAFEAIPMRSLTAQPSTVVDNLICGDYFWTVIAYDKDRHFRIIAHEGEQIARFTVGTPDLTVTEITNLESSGCENRVNIAIANHGTAAAGPLVLTLFKNQELVAQRTDSARLAPGEQIIFENIDVGIVCEDQPLIAWINRDLSVLECDTSNNSKRQIIRSAVQHDLRITKRADLQVVRPGELIHYTLSITNDSCCEAREVTVIDSQPIFVKATRFQAPLPVDSTDTDRLVWELGTLPANAQVEIRYVARIEPFTVRINFQNDRYGWTDRDLVDYNEAEKDVDALATRLSPLLAGHNALRLHIAGYTSSPGSAGYNLQLSKNRAETIREQLVRRLESYDPDFDEARITSVGRGEKIEFRKFPDDTHATFDEAGKVVISRMAKQAANRRVEIEFINLPDIVNSCEVRSREEDSNPSNNSTSVTVRIKS